MCSKLAQKEYKNKHDLVGMVTHCELCKGLRSDHTNEKYMHEPESVIKMRPIKSSRISRSKWITQSRPDLELINKKTWLTIVVF